MVHVCVTSTTEMHCTCTHNKYYCNTFGTCISCHLVMEWVIKNCGKGLNYDFIENIDTEYLN